MTSGTILLFYKYVHLENPTRLMRWQKKLCADLGLTGRIIIAHEGINATVGGTQENVAHYKAALIKNPLFADIDFKESTGGSSCFPRMRIVVRNEIVALGVGHEKAKYEHTGTHLTPQQTHTLLQNPPPDLVILDARNTCESAIGKFRNAITPAIDHFRDLPAYMDANLDLFKDKQVLMYCTGGIRCERASAYLQEKKVAKHVYQIEGGIQRYTDAFPDGFFRGKNYVFDGRISVKINEDVLGSCTLCGSPCDDYINCLNATCNKHTIVCSSCAQQFNNTCSTSCQDIVTTNQNAARPLFHKISVSGT